jgi:hypothetical protein
MFQAEGANLRLLNLRLLPVQRGPVIVFNNILEDCFVRTLGLVLLTTGGDALSTY